MSKRGGGWGVQSSEARRRVTAWVNSTEVWGLSQPFLYHIPPSARTAEGNALPAGMAMVLVLVIAMLW